MDNKNNKKVPLAILSCFLIVFIIQGMLKLSGIFVFEKALNWEIFALIDNSIFLQILYYSIVALISVYCLSFALTGKLYSKKWYVYILLIIASFGVTIMKFYIKTPFLFEFIYDAFSYILIPIVINIIENKGRNIIELTTIQILLYFAYLGLCYWSNLLNSLLPITQTVLHTSTHFLIYFEVYIGLVLLALSLNIFVKKEE